MHIPMKVASLRLRPCRHLRKKAVSRQSTSVKQGLENAKRVAEQRLLDKTIYIAWKVDTESV